MDYAPKGFTLYYVDLHIKRDQIKGTVPMTATDAITISNSMSRILDSAGIRVYTEIRRQTEEDITA